MDGINVFSLQENPLDQSQIFFVLLLWTWLHSAHFSASLQRSIRWILYIERKDQGDFDSLLNVLHDLWDGDPNDRPNEEGLKKKKKKKGGPTSIASLSSNEKSNERKGKKKKKRGELISDGIEAIITRLASVLALLILMSSLIRFNLTAPNWSTGIFSFSYFLYLSPPPPTTYGVTHIDFCAKRI